METLYFGNDEIYYAKIVTNRKKASVVNAKTYSLSEGSIINGIIINSYTCKNMVEQICEENAIKKVVICVDSTSIVYKVKKVPPTSKGNMINFVKTEFIEVSAAMKEPVYDYSIIATKNAQEVMDSILAICCEKSFLQSYIDLFQNDKVKIEAIDVGMNAVSKVCAYEKLGENETFVLIHIVKNSMILNLFVEGRYYFTSKGRILQEEDTEDFQREFVQKVSQINQFNKSQRNNSNIENVFVTGLSRYDFATCKEMLQGIGINLCEYAISDVSSKQTENLEKYIYNIGSVLQRGVNC